MSSIEFNCPQCGQHLAVDATAAGATVTCPKCGQAILVPQLARVAQAPSRGRGRWLALLGVVVLSLLAAGLLLRQRHGHPGAASAGVPASAPALPGNLAHGLVLYFNFGSEPPAGTVPDLSGYGNNGQAVNVQWVADGHRGGCIQFGLTNSYIRVPDNDSLNPTNLTLAAWINTSFTDRIWRRIFDKAYGKEFDLTMGGDNAVGGANDGRSWRGQVALEVVHQWAPSGVHVADGRWHQVVGTFNGSVLRLYIDGWPIGSPHRAKGRPKHSAYDLTIGENRSIGSPEEMGQSFNGLMDDVMMFNRALSPEEVAALYDSQKTASDANNEPAAPLVLPSAVNAIHLAPAVPSTELLWPADRFLPTFPAPAPVIDCIDLDSTSSAERNLFASLEGLVNRQQPRLACVDNRFAEGKFTWLKLHHLSYRMINGYDAILKYRASATGLIVTDPARRDTLNLATTLAGLNDELICDPDLLTTLTNAPYNLRVMDDLRGRFSNKYEVYHYLYTNCWPRCTHRIIAGLAPNSHFGLRDYVIAVKAAAVWLNPRVPADASALLPFVADMKPMGGVYLGWWSSEVAGLGWIAQFGIPVIASDFYANASLFSGVTSPIFIPPIPPPPPLQNKVYVAIILSDGDNLQHMQHRMKWGWSKAARGSVPLGWTVQPVAADMDPLMLNYYWSTATSNDCLITGASGAGYNWLDHWSATDVTAFTRASNPYLQRSGIRVIEVTQRISRAAGNSFATSCPSLMGLFDVTAGAHAKVYWGLPVVGFAGGPVLADGNRMINAINKAGAGWNGQAPRFIAVQGSGWNMTPADVQEVANALDKNEYAVVRPDQLFLLARAYFYGNASKKSAILKP